MRIRHQRALAAAVAIPLLLLGATACSNDEDTPSAEPTPTETTDLATDEPTDAATTTGATVEDPQQVFEDMVAAMRAAKTVTVASDLGVGTAEGAMSYDADRTDLSLRMDIGPMAGVELRVVDGELFMSWPNVLTEAGKFFRIEEGSSMGDLVESLRSSSPVDSAADISESVTAMREVGEEQIGTDDTIHYVVTIDTEKSSQFIGGTEGAQDVELPETIDVDMWVTTDDLMRRVVVSLGTAAMQLDYTDWGKPVDISAPAPQDIVKAPKGF
ncbi:MAG TPA: hypothetical protein VFK52_10350 [Nocardioidaceae bacterium]|nr:hypothetical protein [Nocardioidaceae bacterium]